MSQTTTLTPDQIDAIRARWDALRQWHRDIWGYDDPHYRLEEVDGRVILRDPDGCTEVEITTPSDLDDVWCCGCRGDEDCDHTDTTVSDVCEACGYCDRCGCRC